MPLPTQQTCDIPTEVPCAVLFDTAEKVLTTAYTAWKAVVPDDCDEIPAYVATGEPSYTDDGEYLAVWLIDSSPAPTQPNRSQHMPRPRGRFGVKLVEKGWPTIEGYPAMLTVPQAERMHALSRHSYSRIEKIQRALYDSFRKPDPHGCCQFQSMGTLRAGPRTSGLISWSIDLTLGICW